MKTLLACVLTILLSFQMIFPIFAADAVTTTDQPVVADRPTVLDNRGEPTVTESKFRANGYIGPSVSPTISSVQTGSKNQLKYPNGVEFESLKKIIDTKFIANISKNTYSYTNNCILGGRFCPN